MRPSKPQVIRRICLREKGKEQMCAVDFSVRGPEKNELKRRIKVHGGTITFLSYSVIWPVCWLIFRAALYFMYAADIIVSQAPNQKDVHPNKKSGSLVSKIHTQQCMCNDYNMLPLYVVIQPVHFPQGSRIKHTHPACTCDVVDVFSLSFLQ